MSNEYKIPNHVGIIMDGNGRWATERGIKRSAGHSAGYKTLKKLAVHILNKGVNIYQYMHSQQKILKEM